MEGTQTMTREEGTTERNGDQGTSSNVPMSSKPLHRFVRKEPRSLGVTHQISKVLNKQMTVCLALYVVSIFGIVISFLYRIIHFFSYPHFYMLNHLNRTSALLQSIEAILLTSSFCVLVILIFLATVARFALKSTHNLTKTHFAGLLLHLFLN
uniref:Uncharacterized protein n=1 Tax=Oreochromis aureus TaxID=47969 RepID=A0A668SP39_OREAU